MKLNDIFHTLQGEGANFGRAALFIRLPFCNLSCSWCDTEFDSFTEYSTQAIEAFMDHCASKFAVLTGGEPAMNLDTPLLIELLKRKGFEIAMESNGQFLVSDSIDFLTISPKRWTTKNGLPGEHPPFWFHPQNRPSEIKLVVDDQMMEETIDHLYRRWEDGEFRFRQDPPLFFLSPEWNAKETVLPKITEYISKNPQWRLSLQNHKYAGIK